MRMLLATVAAAALAVGCSGVPAVPAHHRSTTPATIKLTKYQACRQLLDDVTHHRGIPDIPALRRVADHVTDPRMAGDARTAVRDIAHTGTAPIAFALLRADCADVGVRIPAP